jgi:hypothetical protein
MTLRRQKKLSGKWCLTDATSKRFMTGPLRKQSRGWRFRLAKHGFYEPAAVLRKTVLQSMSSSDGRMILMPSLSTSPSLSVRNYSCASEHLREFDRPDPDLNQDRPGGY